YPGELGGWSTVGASSTMSTDPVWAAGGTTGAVVGTAAAYGAPRGRSIPGVHGVPQSELHRRRIGDPLCTTFRPVSDALCGCLAGAATPTAPAPQLPPRRRHIFYDTFMC